MRIKAKLFLFILILSLAAGLYAGRKAELIDAGVFAKLRWRSIGPAIMGGRITDIEAVPGNPRIVYVATASSGLWKSEDGGVTWKPIFDSQGVLSIGDIALDPHNPEVVWVGTGEDNPRNSVSYGRGIYMSPDGGRSWHHMGLEGTERIARVVVHPQDSRTIFVAAIGKVFGPSKERGVYVSRDGGRSWERVLYIDEYHGASDVEINPANPNIVYAGMWRFQRKPWDFDSGSRKGGLFISVDGGRSWKKVKGIAELAGRIGVKVAPSRPEVVYAIVEAKECSLYRSQDWGHTFRCVYRKPEIVSRGFYYTELRVDPKDENRVYAVSSRLWLSEDGGRSFRPIARSIHVDFHTMWIDPKDPQRIWVGNDGGIAVSYNRGRTWRFVNNLPLGQFYHVYADRRKPFYYVCGGLQDNGTWCGPSRTRDFFGILNHHWFMISFGDGFWVVSHPEDPDLYLSEYQAGNLFRTNMRTGEVQLTSPYPKRNDGGPVKELRYRFNWNSPIVQSPHDPKTVYFCGNVVFRSRDFGLTWERISPDLTTNDPAKQGSAGGPVFPENTTAEYHCTITAFAESPVKAGVLWAGTDDGNLQVSVDDGRSWRNVVRNIKGLAAASPVSHIEASRRGAGVAYVSFDRHMFDDFSPYIYVTEDYGRSWRRITEGIDEGAYVHVVREDPRNPDLLYAGTELGLYVSWDRGRHWQKLAMANLPAVPVYDIVIHPEANDIILGTHGRSIWIFDDATPIQQISPEVLRKSLHVFPPRPALLYIPTATRVFLGDAAFAGPNPPYGALIYYYLKEEPAKKQKGKLFVYDSSGRLIRKLEFKPEKGVNLVVWDLTHQPPKPRKERKGEEIFAFLFGPRAPRVLPGRYRLELEVGGLKAETWLEVKLDPTVKVSQQDLQRWHSASMQIRDMIDEVNAMLRRLDSLKRQIAQLRKTLKQQLGKVPDDVEKELKAREKEADELVKSLAREEGPMWSQGMKLADHLSSLLSALQKSFRAPTAAQMAFLEELKQELARKREEFRKLRRSVDSTNRLLSSKGLPVILLKEIK